MENIENLKAQMLAQVQGVSDMKAWDDLRVALIGKKGQITELLKGMSSLPLEQKIEMGKKLNVLKSDIESALNDKKNEIAKALNNRSEKSLTENEKENTRRLHI